MPNVTLEEAARIVQLALTPVFLLSGIAALLNVFATRLARVADQSERISTLPQDPIRDLRLRRLRFRSRCLDFAVVLAALAGASTCGAVLYLFLGGIGELQGGSVLFLLFGGAIVLTMGALWAYVLEMLVAARGVRRRIDRDVK